MTIKEAYAILDKLPLNTDKLTVTDEQAIAEAHAEAKNSGDFSSFVNLVRAIERQQRLGRRMA